MRGSTTKAEDRWMTAADVAAHVMAGERNGYRPRARDTSVFEIELLIPGKRQGPAYFPSLLEPPRRCEQAIVAVVFGGRA
jgi:transposase-like protein